MSIKPFKKILSNHREKESEPEFKSTKPFKRDTQEKIQKSGMEDFLENGTTTEEIKPSLNLLSNVYGLLLALFIFILLALFADMVERVQSMATKASLSEYIYLSGLAFLFFVLLLNIVSNIKQLRSLQKVKEIKQKFLLQKVNPSKEIIPLANLLLKYYSKSKDPQVLQITQEIKEELNNSQIYKEIYKDLDTKLLKIVDNKVKEKIHKASLQAALSTAISPFALFDMLLIVWRSVTLTKEIATLYGLRVGGFSSIILLKQALFNVAFAGVSELASELTQEATGTTLLTKVSQSTGQGVANGILLARLGYGIMKACRPIEVSQERGSFVKKIISSIFKTISTQEKK